MIETIKTIVTSKKFIYALLGFITLVAIMALGRWLGFSEAAIITTCSLDAGLWGILIHAQGTADTGKSAAEIEKLTTSASVVSALLRYDANNTHVDGGAIRAIAQALNIPIEPPAPAQEGQK